MSKLFRSAGECIALHAKVLRFVGFLRAAPGASRAHWAGRVHGAYRGGVLALTMLYLAQECVYAYLQRTDMAKLSRVMFLLLCHVTSLAKQLVFHLDADRIDTMIGGFDDPLFNGGERHAARLRASCRERARRVECVYAGCAVLTCTLWLVFPVLDRARGCAVEFPFSSGFHTDPPLVFAAVLLYSYYVTTLVGIANTTADAFMVTVLYQCQTQFQILRFNLESLPESAWELSMSSGEEYESALKRLFVRCLRHYQHVVDMAESMQNIFGSAILVQFGIGGWILCMAAYKLVSLSALSIEFASMALFMFCILTELFLYCYFGTELSVESERIAGSVYAMRWLRTRLPFRRSLLLLAERARRPLRPTAARLLPLCLDTFLKILKSSYTFYAVLRQTK